ncbi:DUF2493 domain-containing protein [Sphingomonas sp. 22176]|uniref:DUF2493 domain-containing protein n=1 Tax=Sphingomonas sp. 22176 TaxID=3453884 RepID=UPI003F848EC1
MTKETTSARLTSFAQLGEALRTEREQAIAAAFVEETAATRFVEAFGEVGALSIVEAGAPAQELDMPEPAEAQHDCHAIMVTLFDLFRDTRLETSAQAIAWGFVNSFHFEAAKLAREEDALSLELGEMVRHPDSSEIYAVELEELQLRTQTKMEQRAAIECMRDYAAECYHAQTGRPWSSARGTRVSSATTASQIAAADFLKARATALREQRAPSGPLVVFSGGQEWHDHEQIWTRLDQIKARVPNMTLCTTAQRKGADAIATAWAASKGVPVVAFTPNTARHGKRAGFVRNDQLAGLRPVEAIVCEGSGIQANLLDSLKKAGVPTHAFRHSTQAPAPQRSMWG